MRSHSLKQIVNSETTPFCTLCFTLLVMWITNISPWSDPTLTKWGVLIHEYIMRTAWKVKFSVFSLSSDMQRWRANQHAKKTRWIWTGKKMTCDLHHSHLQLFKLLPVINVDRAISIINQILHSASTLFLPLAQEANSYISSDFIDEPGMIYFTLIRTWPLLLEKQNELSGRTLPY